MDVHRLLGRGSTIRERKTFPNQAGSQVMLSKQYPLFSSKTRVYLTVDVETSMGGAWRYPDRRPLSIDKVVFCKRGDVSYGLPLIVEELRRYGLRATFFTEVFFSQCLGADQAKIIFDYLLSHGQDVQLHTHPVFRYYSLALKAGTPEAFHRYRAFSDALSGKDAETQYALLSEASELFKGFTGERPVAFRAGGFLGDHNTLAALARLRIPIDSSYNPSVRASFPDQPPKPNVVQRIDGVIEMPLTNAVSGINVSRSWKPMAISSVSFSELKAVLTQAHRAAARDVVFIVHSFSTVKPRDVFYSSLRPDWLVISRLRRLLKYLADNASIFEVCTVRDAASEPEHSRFENCAPKLYLGLVKPLIRKGLQALNRVYWI